MPGRERGTRRDIDARISDGAKGFKGLAILSAIFHHFGEEISFARPAPKCAHGQRIAKPARSPCPTPQMLREAG